MTLATSATLLAHQGGWDEALLVAGPILVIVGVLAVAKKRVDAQVERDESHDGGDMPEPAGDEGRPGSSD